MRKTLLIISVLFLSLLQAQVVELPDVEVTAESAIQAYLYKKAMRFGTEIPAYDSIPAFLPILRQVPRQAPILRRKAPLEFYLVSGLSTEGLLRNHLSYYPQDPNIKLISVDYYPAITNAHRKSHQLELGINLQIKEHYLFPELIHQYSSSPGLKQSNLNAQISHRSKDYTFGSFLVSNPGTSLGFGSYSQELAGIKQKASFPYFKHSSKLSYKDHRVDIDILAQEGETALELLYILPQMRFALEDLGIGLLTDFRGIAPAISMSYRPILREREYLLVQNHSSIVSQNWNDRFASYRHLARNPKERLALQLYKLEADYHRLSPGTHNLKHISFRVGNSYTVNSDQLSFNGVSPQARSTDLFSSYLGAEARFTTQDAVLTQTAYLNLDYLPCDNYRRLTYSPLFTLKSSLAYDYSGVGLVFDLDQHYNILGTNGSKLPEDVDLSITANYEINEHFHLSGGLKRVFGSKATQYIGLPYRGRELWAELRAYF
jgi:hypothetical protein